MAYADKPESAGGSDVDTALQGASHPDPWETSDRPYCLGPHDHGRIIELEEFQACTEEDGWFAEIIDGVVYMSPSPNLRHQIWRKLFWSHLSKFAEQNRKLADFVDSENDVVIDARRRRGPTRPRPDITVYRGFLTLKALELGTDWADLPPPILVVEVLSPSTKDHDLHYKAHVYWEQEGIAEYWIVDPLANPLEPILTVRTRRPGKNSWTEQTVPFGETYHCGCLPGLEVNLKTLRLSLEDQ